MTLRRILIANRGEIALRILRTCQRLGIETVLAASEADLDSLPARLADRTIRLGPAPASASYLDVDAVVSAALAVRADAIHPGYGFLSENPRLAEDCARAGLVFLGPTGEQLAAVGDKLAARGHAVAASLPVVAGGEVDEVDGARAVAAEVGYPLLVKAVGGGGGRGMTRVDEAHQLAETVERSMAEAGAAFGDPRMYLERFVASGRHVEVQLLGDGETVLHLGDRDCSVQRRYQKLVEEAPAPHLGDGLRAQIRDAAVAFGTYLRYRGLGTVEFLVDCDRDTFHFLEMNARIQVEHPVTEAICGMDLVAAQIAVGEGQPLRVTQGDVTLAGHAIECRVNAERWAREFQPSPGRVTGAVLPAGDGVRVDTHIQAGSQVPPFYDSLLAKLVAYGPERAGALARLRDALARCDISGVETNVPLHLALTATPEFAGGGVDTSFLPRFLADHGPAEAHPAAGGARG